MTKNYLTSFLIIAFIMITGSASAQSLQQQKTDSVFALVKKYFKLATEKEAALLMEFVLHGLAAYSLISKKVVEGKIEFKDLIGSMVNLGSSGGGFGSEEEDLDDFN